MREMIKESDFIICEYVSLTSMTKENMWFKGSWYDPTDIVKTLETNMKSIKPEIEVMLKTRYYSNHIGIEDFKGAWDNFNLFASKQNIAVWIEGAFDSPVDWNREDTGWWKLTDNDMINVAGGYVEKVSGKPVYLPKITRPIPKKPVEKDKDTNDFISISFATVGLVLTVLSLTAIVTIVRKRRKTLPRNTGVETVAAAGAVSPNRNSCVHLRLRFSGFSACLNLFSQCKISHRRSRNVVAAPQPENILARRDVHEFKHGLSADKVALLRGDRFMSVSALKRPYDKSLEIKKRKLEILREQVLGEGIHGVVCKAILKNSSNNHIEVALKMLKHDSPSMAIKGFLSEIKILTYLGQHDNIVSICGAYTTEIQKGVIYIATELCPLGSLHKYLVNCQNTVKEKSKSSWNKYYTNAISFHDGVPYKDMLRWTHEIASGMEYLAQKNVIHADLATRNVLLSSDGTAKITDFGLSRRLYEYQEYMKKTQEPMPWRSMAVESLKNLHFSVQSDVWSYGVTLWEIYSLGDLPFPERLWTPDFVESLENGLRLQQPHYAGPEIYKIMSDCWQLQPDDRPSFTRLRESTRLLCDTYCV